MGKQRYTASKSRSQGRSAWSISFRHPVCRDADDKLGAKVRRGLGTADEAKADALVAEMNTLLSDESYWNIAERSRAEQRFTNSVVRAFYGPMESPAGSDLAAVRDAALPLPGRDEGYSRVLFMGTTGTGKTSLLRQLIGSHPDKDRFPSTSTGKTTIADIEVITSPGDFEAVVTFFPQRLIRTHVAESILEACKTAWRGDSDKRVARDLLNHKEQRFRLGYILGNWAPEAEAGDDDDWGDDPGTADEAEGPASESMPTENDREAMQSFLDSCLESIRELVEQSDRELSEELEEPLRKLAGDDQEAALALLVERLEKTDAYSTLIDAIMNEIGMRFNHLDGGKLTKRGGWPEKWTYSDGDREAFIRKIRWFSSNHHKAYGRLLTPVVQGIRVRGPLLAGFLDDVPKLVLLDGEGLGHTPESAANVSTHYTSRYALVDVILLVDNAEQPMQAAPLSVLRSVATGGYQDKLAIAFTHFDSVKGDNLPDFSAKRDHVLASLRSALSSLRDAIGDVAASALERKIEDRCFMLGMLDRPIDKIPGGPRKQLLHLAKSIEKAIEPEPRPDARPKYDPAGLAFAVQSAAGDFHSLWDARLGYRHRDGVYKEHWARVKALTRRVALRMDNCEYQHLMPVAELLGRLSEAISRFLDAPARWDPAPSDDDEAASAIAQIRAEVHTALHSFAMERIVEQHLVDWSRAFDYAGKGSTYERAQELRDIYGEAAPVPGIELSEVASDFLSAVRRLVFRAIKKGGGELVLSE
ncbi:MAG: GTPase domain-containing protein [Pseudomonadota bacterium]